jgi:hypothetical protein
MLQNAVHSVDELGSIQNQADQHNTQTGISLTYKQYVSLLLSAAVSYDATFKQCPSSKRSVYRHELQEDSITNMDATYDINSPIGVIDANFHARGSCMSLQ